MRITLAALWCAVGFAVSGGPGALAGDKAAVEKELKKFQGTWTVERVEAGGKEVPIDYRMRRAGERWLVYDVVIEGVSLVANYRSQFNRIIQTSSYQELLSRLRSQDGGRS